MRALSVASSRAMRIGRVVLAGTLLIAGAQVAAAGGESYMLINGHVYGEQGWAEALAVKDGRIVAVGSASSVASSLPGKAPRVDLKGATVFPGFHDMHVHPFNAGMLLTSCRFPQDAGIKAVTAAVAACVAKAKPGEWIQGGQWTAAQFAKGELDRATLDAVAPDNPVVLVDTSGHSLWVNSKALDLAEIGRDTPNPEGGIIERDAEGRPNGLLRDGANGLIRGKIPSPTPEASVAALGAALDIMVSYGITALEDAIVDERILNAYMTLDGEGRLKPHVRGCLVWNYAKYPNPRFEQLLADRARYQRSHYKMDCVKIFMDGVPTESHTGAMLHPYEQGGTAGAPPRGLLMVQPAALNAMVTRLDKDGVMAKFHAAGDWAVRASIDAIAAARSANGMNGPRHQVGHLTFVDPADFARAKPLGLTLEFSPYLWFPQPIVGDIERAVGPERNKRAWPVREGMETGAPVIVGSDWPIVPSVNPWIAIETLVTRRAPGDSAGPAYGEDEAITLDQAIHLFTDNAARELNAGEGRGVIAAGEPADLVIVDRNPFSLPVTEIHSIKVLRTIIGGQTAWQAPVAE
ncbi:MAG: amidohydrolase [Sphingobium sp.]|nr:MAG: amidohydrolase [Sphingobium sp.]